MTLNYSTGTQLQPMALLPIVIATATSSSSLTRQFFPEVSSDQKIIKSKKFSSQRFVYGNQKFDKPDKKSVLRKMARDLSIKAPDRSKKIQSYKPIIASKLTGDFSSATIKTESSNPDQIQLSIGHQQEMVRVKKTLAEDKMTLNRDKRSKAKDSRFDLSQAIKTDLDEFNNPTQYSSDEYSDDDISDFQSDRSVSTLGDFVLVDHLQNPKQRSNRRILQNETFSESIFRCDKTNNNRTYTWSLFDSINEVKYRFDIPIRGRIFLSFANYGSVINIRPLNQTTMSINDQLITNLISNARKHGNAYLFDDSNLNIIILVQNHRVDFAVANQTKHLCGSANYSYLMSLLPIELTTVANVRNLSNISGNSSFSKPFNHTGNYSYLPDLSDDEKKHAENYSHSFDSPLLNFSTTIAMEGGSTPAFHDTSPVFAIEPYESSTANKANSSYWVSFKKDGNYSSFEIKCDEAMRLLQSIVNHCDKNNKDLEKYLSSLINGSRKSHQSLDYHLNQSQSIVDLDFDKITPKNLSSLVNFIKRCDLNLSKEEEKLLNQDDLSLKTCEDGGYSNLNNIIIAVSIVGSVLLCSCTYLACRTKPVKKFMKKVKQKLKKLNFQEFANAFSKRSSPAPAPVAPAPVAPAPAPTASIGSSVMQKCQESKCCVLQ